MQNIFPASIVVAIIIIAGWLTWGSLSHAPQTTEQVATTTSATTTGTEQRTSYECNGDAKICPDGSSVGRTGPSCEFAACPPVTAKNGTIRTTMGQPMTAINVTITPRVVIDDSRCPTDVQCIWAGTVKTKVTIKTSEGTSDETLEIGKPLQKGSYTITFTELTPAKHSGEEIPDSSYRFVFIVEKK